MLKEAGFVNIEQFLDSHDLRDDEKNRMLRAWEFNEGIIEDCMVQNAKEEILMQRENEINGAREKENEVFATFAGIKKKAKTVKSKVLGEKRNFITRQAATPRKTNEEMNYSSDESYFSNY